MTPAPRDVAASAVALLPSWLADPEFSWSMGTVGAIAEFIRDPDEPVRLTTDSAVTARGGIRLVAPAGLHPLAYETPAGPGSTVAAAVVRAGPHRVFETACGRTEVYSAIPAPDGRSPDGPHTHLLPHLLASGRTHPPTVPVPPGLLPCAYCYPPHPATDHLGRPRGFDRVRYERFQSLLELCGSSEQLRAKRAVFSAVRAAQPPPRAGSATGPQVRAAVSVALRQLARLDGPSAALASWRAAHGIDPDLLDPAGDRNGG